MGYYRWAVCPECGEEVPLLRPKPKRRTVGVTIPARSWVFKDHERPMGRCPGGRQRVPDDQMPREAS